MLSELTKGAGCLNLVLLLKFRTVKLRTAETVCCDEINASYVYPVVLKDVEIFPIDTGSDQVFWKMVRGLSPF
jgi:hypothetical protein